MKNTNPISRGVIKQVGQDLPKADEEIDLQGRLVVPPYVDSHLHLDYVYTGRNEGAANTSGTLFEGIARWHDVKKTQTLEDAKERALKGIREEVYAPYYSTASRWPSRLMQYVSCTLSSSFSLGE